MTIDTNDIKKGAPYVVAGSVASLLASSITGIAALLVAEAVAIGGIVAYRSIRGRKEKQGTCAAGAESGTVDNKDNKEDR